MKTKNLEKAYEALEKWKKEVTVEKFVEDHKRLGLVKTKETVFPLKVLYSILVVMLMLPVFMCSILWCFNQHLPHQVLLQWLTVLFGLWYIEKFVFLIRRLFWRNK